MRQFFRIVLLALVLVTVFLVSALTSMRLAIHGREVAVPKLVGLTSAEAARTAAAQGLQVDFENRFYSADVPEGRVMTQVPAPGSAVRRGWKIRVAQSLGPQRVTIPSVIGQSPRAAQMNLGRRGLELGAIATIHQPDLPPDQVVAQSPPANAEGIASPKVNLLMTVPVEGQPQFYVMPDFIGRRFGQATSAIAEAGFKVGNVNVKPATLPANGSSPAPPQNGSRLRPIATDLVVGQSPAAGQKIPAGSTINFELLR